MMFNITNHQENANQNHFCQNGYYQKNNKKQELVKMLKKRIIVPYWWECKFVQPLWKTV